MIKMMKVPPLLIAIPLHMLPFMVVAVMDAVRRC
jgi:hypothetical protein